jgi:hypothetical protein
MMPAPRRAAPLAKQRHVIRRIVTALYVAAIALGIWSHRHVPAARDDDQLARALRQRRWQIEDRMRGEWELHAGDLRPEWNEVRGHLAIVLTNLGDELRNFERLLASRYPLSFALAPRAPYRSGVLVRLLEDPRRPREIWIDARGSENSALNHEAEALTSDVEQEWIGSGAMLEPPLCGMLRRHPFGPHEARFETSAHLHEDLNQVEAYLLDTNEFRVASSDEPRVRAVPSAHRATIVIPHSVSAEQIRTELDRALLQSTFEPVLVIVDSSALFVEAFESAETTLKTERIGVFGACELLLHLNTFPDFVRSETVHTGGTTSQVPLSDKG